MTRIADIVASQQPLYISARGRSFADPGGTTYPEIDTNLTITVDVPDSVYDEAGVEGELKALFAANLQITHASVGETPSLTLRIGGRREHRKQLKQILGQMSRRERADTTITFAGTVANFAGNRVDRVVRNLQKSGERAYTDAGRIYQNDKGRQQATSDGDILAGVTPETKMAFSISGNALDILRRGGQMSYPALRALRREMSSRYR